MFNKTKLSLLMVLAVAIGLANARTYHYRHKSNIVPLGWELHDSAPVELKNHRVSFTLALYQQNLDELDKRFWLVSNHRSEYYGAYMTQEEVRKLTQPSDEDRETVMEWVSEHGAEIGRDNGDSLEVYATLGQIEQMFTTKMGVYRHKNFGTKYVSYLKHVSIENEEVASKIHVIVGLELPYIEKDIKKRISQGTEDTAYTCVTPDTLYNMYNVDGRNSSFNNAQNSRCATEFQEVKGNLAFSKSDLSTFQQGMNLAATDITNIIGEYDTDSTVGEANLDVQYITSFTSEIETTYWTGKLWIYEWTQEVLNTTNPPLIHSLSYSWPETYQCPLSPDCDGMSPSQYINRTNIELQKFGVLGMTVLVASGDQGANGVYAASDNCKNESNWLQPQFPSSSPYVISVGATALLIGSVETETFDDVSACKSDVECISSGIEITCTQYANLSATDIDNPLITSGGGFSLFSANTTAPYQQSAVQKYMSIEAGELPPTQYWNPYGRAYPDISALGHAYAVYGTETSTSTSGSYTPVDGTSASTPALAGMLSMINGNQLNNGKPSLGFFNPLLYTMANENPETIRDITVGDNKCTEMQTILGLIPVLGPCCQYGYNAVEGFDPVTGLGAMIFDEALDYISQNTQAPTKFFN